MKNKLFKIGDNIITNQNIMGSQHYVEVHKNTKGKIIEQIEDFSPGIKRWAVKFPYMNDSIIVFESEIEHQ